MTVCPREPFAKKAFRLYLNPDRWHKRISRVNSCTMYYFLMTSCIQDVVYNVNVRD